MLAIKKGDIIIIAVILLTAITLMLVFFFSTSEGKTIVIKSENRVIYELPLDENKVVELSHNTIEIKNGTVDVINADCKNQVCVKHKKIKKKGETIVCLPNKIIVEIK